MKKTKIISFAAFLYIVTLPLLAETEKTILSGDTTKVIDIEEVLVIASPKTNAKLRQQPTAVSIFSQNDLRSNNVTSLKNLTTLTPNFFLPDYGSRLTSAIYIRGIGSRINTPAVGLYVDNIPYLDKSAFDINLYDIERINILRGPQGTLYGRNTMGGLIQAYTKSPFNYQGTDLTLGAATGNNSYKASLTHYHRISDRFAFSAGGFYEGARGFFKNKTLNKWADPLQSGGGRLRAIYLPSANLKFDLNVNFEYSDEGGYAYGLVDRTTGKVGDILSDEKSKYRRGLLNAGLNIEHQAQNFTFNSITGYQNLNDRMFMDQDFSAAKIYTLEQKQKLNAWTQEFTFKSKAGTNWQWATGISGYYQTLNTKAPITFKEDGVAAYIESGINSNFPTDYGMSLDITDKELYVASNFDTPIVGAAIYHQSTINNLFTKGLSLTFGIRLDYEHTKITYDSSLPLNWNFLFSYGKMGTINLTQSATSKLNGSFKKDYTQILPKFALKYDFNPRSNIYASVTKGYRSGGYNIQMVSDMMTSEMQKDMVSTLKTGIGEKLTSMHVPDRVTAMILGNIPDFEGAGNPKDIIMYKPETSWSYEVGSHLTLAKGRLWTDLTAFYMDTRDQQLTKFINSGLGRVMVNAGKSHSLGIEAKLIGQMTDSWSGDVSYGFTRATFDDYNGGTNSKGETIDYSGNYVPFVPRHTLNIGSAYVFQLKNSPIQHITVHADYRGTGKIYWTEANNASQSFYGVYNGRVSAKTKKAQLDLWVENIFGKKYNTFYFESMGKGFAQINKPRRFGIDLRLNF